MTADLKSVLLRQHETAWTLLAYHLDGLTTEACLWRPGEGHGPHVRQGEDGLWRGDWPQDEAYTLGPASIGWISWHMIYWWTTVLDESFGDGSGAGDTQVTWPGSADGVRAALAELHARWVDAVSELDGAALQSVERTRWPFTGRPFADIVAWVNTELVKNTAELGYVRFLRGA